MVPPQVSRGKEREGGMAVVFLHDDWQHDGTCGGHTALASGGSLTTFRRPRGHDEDFV